MVHANKKDVIKRLRAALKDADELYLATDEDREGEAISWHLLQELKPSVPVKRMVFHEITRSAAIEHAVDNWRDIDYGLVDAQETRRIVDRLFGYPVSEVLWRKVNRGLSAGRVQSPAVRLVVERERERIALRRRRLLGPRGRLPRPRRSSPPPSSASTGRKVASGKDFDDSGHTMPRRRRARRAGSPAAWSHGSTARRSRCAATEEKPFRSSPKPPFMTSTLQQEGGRKLRMSSAQVMRVGPGAVPERLHHLHADRLARRCRRPRSPRPATRPASSTAPTYVPDAAAHLRPQGQERAGGPRGHPAGGRDRSARPTRCRGELRGDQLRLYDLIWKRTVASQMADARGQSVSVRLGADRGRRSRHRVGRVRPHDHVPRLPAGLRGGRRRP